MQLVDLNFDEHWQLAEQADTLWSSQVMKFNTNVLHRRPLAGRKTKPKTCAHSPGKLTRSLSNSSWLIVEQRSTSYLLLDWTGAQGKQADQCWKPMAAQSGCMEHAHSRLTFTPTHINGPSSLPMCHTPY